MKFNIEIDKVNAPRTEFILHGESLDQVRGGIKSAIKELEKQLDRYKCSDCRIEDGMIKDSDFLYVKTSEGKWVALYKGEIKSTRSDTFMGGTFDHIKGDRIIWGSVHNPPAPPTEVPYNPIQTETQFELTFENPVPDHWTKPGFYLEYENIRFIIDSTYQGSDGSVLTTASSIKF